MEGRTVPVFLDEFDRVDVTISFVRNGRELECESTGGAYSRGKLTLPDNFEPNELCGKPHRRCLVQIDVNCERKRHI